MNYQDTIGNMPREVYRRLKRAVELGKWPDGKALSAQQRQDALQAIIAWGEMHLPAPERVGYLEGGCKSGKGTDPASSSRSGDPQVYEPGQGRG